MTPINAFYKINRWISIRREGDIIFLTDGAKETRLTKDVAWAVGTHLRDITDDHLVAGGWVAMSPNPYQLDRLDYERDS